MTERCRAYAWGFWQHQFRCSAGSPQGVICVEGIFGSCYSLVNASRDAQLWLVFTKQGPLYALFGRFDLGHWLSCWSSSPESSAGSERVVVEHLRAWSTGSSGFEKNISC